jgi:hypothetical protein
MVTSTKDEPELRAEAQGLLDQVRDIRKRIDEMRIEEMAKKRAESVS